MRTGPVLFFLSLGAVPLPVAAQWQASAGLGSGSVRYAGGASFGALILSGAGQWSSPSTFLGGNAAASLLEGGVWATQGRFDIWTALARLRATRVAVSGTAAFSTRSDGVAAGSAATLLEAVRDGYALGAGVVTGVIQQQAGVASLRLRARAWWQVDPATQLSLTTEATRFLGAWYSDVVGGVSYDAGRTVGSFWVSGRLSQAYASTGAASVSFQYFFTPSIAAEISGGNYLRDPFQGLPRAGFIAGGVRIFSSHRAIAPTSTAAPAPALRPLVAQHRGDSAVVRFRMPGAHAVAIAGNWNSWTPAALHPVGNEIWEGALLLSPGTYYFNLVVDGREWVVPGGVATISDGMGGLIAILNVL